MSKTGTAETAEVIMVDQRRKRWSLPEKPAQVRRTYEPGVSVSPATRQECAAASLLFPWRQLERQNADG